MRMGAPQGFPRAAVPVGVFSRAVRGSQGASRAAPRKSGLHGRGEGERVIAPESWEGTRASRRLEKDSRGPSRDSAGKPHFPRLLPVTLGNFPGCL